MIRHILIPLLAKRFPKSFVDSELDGEPCIVFPAKHPDVGDMQIYDVGDEITLVAGNFTHGHFSNYDEIPVAEKEQMIAEDVADFLEKLFSDRVILWGAHESCGGWRVIDPANSDSPKHRNEFLWSGPRVA